jgi:hypothetical protein
VEVPGWHRVTSFGSMFHRAGSGRLDAPSCRSAGGGDQVTDGAVDEEFLLADNERDGGDLCGGWVYGGARSHDGSMPCWRHACRTDTSTWAAEG